MLPQALQFEGSLYTTFFFLRDEWPICSQVLILSEDREPALELSRRHQFVRSQGCTIINYSFAISYKFSKSEFYTKMELIDSSAAQAQQQAPTQPTFKLQLPFKTIVKVQSKPPKEKETLFKEGWDELSKHIDWLFGVSQDGRYFKEPSYQNATRLCKLGYSQRLLQMVTERLQALISHKMSVLNSISKEIAQESTNGDTEMIDASGNQSPMTTIVLQDLPFLKELKAFWINLCIQMQSIKDIFHFLERTVLIKEVSDEKSTFWMFALSQLRSEFKQEIKDRLKQGVLALIQEDRKAANQELRDLTSKLIHVMLALNFYRGDFEETFLMHTQAFYKQDSESKIGQMSVGEFTDYVNQVLQSEKERVYQSMDASTLNPLTAILEQELISNHVQVLLTNNPSFNQLILEGNVFQLQALSTLIKKVDKIDVLKAQWTVYLKAEGEQTLKPEIIAKKNYLVLEDLIQLKKKSWGLIGQVFTVKEDIEKFKHALKEAFESFLNKDSNQTAEFMAKFLDYHLRKVTTISGDAQLDQLIEEVLFLFRYAKSKDVFEEFYMRGLSRRLLLKKTASLDGERAMIFKLKTECGDQFTQKVEGMLKDLTISNQFMHVEV